MKTCILPLDSRPCSYNFVKDLAAIKGFECVLPPRSIMDYFREASCFTKISQWLFDNAIDCDALVLSIDQLLFGSLLASRQNSITLNTALERLYILEKLKTANPKLKIFAFNVLMRTTISTINMETKVWWEAVGEYSRYTHIVQLDKTNTSIIKKLEELEATIPEKILKEFLLVRKRNHEVNKECINLVSRGVMEYLLILQEDCSEFGMHKSEQKLLLDMLEKEQLHDRVVLHNGTDEAVTELFARAVSDKPLPIKIKWLGPHNDFIALFEDRPFIYNLKSHLGTVNIIEDDSSDILLIIYPPRDKQGDYCADSKELQTACYSAQEIEAFAKTIASEVNNGKKCFILDIAFANGGDINLLQCLTKYIDIGDLYGYSGWNTASNALGTILSQMVLSGEENNNHNRRFTYSRILDDVLYQGVIRRRLNKKLIDCGDDPWHIMDKEQADKFLNEEIMDFKSLIMELIPRFFLDFNLSFYWPRTFEINIDIKE